MTEATPALPDSTRRSPAPAFGVPLNGARFLVLALLYAALWLYVRPYYGLNHDAQAYAAQAITVIDPMPLAGDIFFAYRSQDEFTIFPRVYGHVIEAVGLDRASAVLTLSFQGLWYFAAFLLLRRLVGTKLAWLGLGTLLTAPLVYGGLRVFHLAEPFLTARLVAEAISLLGLWLWVSERRPLAVGTAIAALAIHPLMAFPVALLLPMLWAAERTSAKVLPLLVGAGCMLAVVGSHLLGGETPLMDGRWLAITQIRSSFLFLDQWDLNDWNHTLLTLLTLIIGIRALDARNTVTLFKAVLWLAIGGLVLTAITTYVFHLEVLIQGQPWRWIWPARFLAVGCLPVILMSLWSRAGTARAGAVFLAAGWLFVLPFSARTSVLLAMGSFLALLSLGLTYASNRISEEISSPVTRGAYAVLGTVLMAALVTASLAFVVPNSDHPMGSGLLPRVASIFSLNTPAMLVAVGCATVVLYHWNAIRGCAVLVVALALFGLAAPFAHAAWTATTYTGTDREAFADWRKLIPADAEVFWWERLRETWFLLERRAYLTRSQSGGIVFSSELADEIARRSLVLAPLSSPEFWLGLNAHEDREPRRLTIEVLSEICRDPELGFVVDDEHLDVAVSVVHWPAPEDSLFLYDCRAVRPSSDGNSRQ